MSVTIPPGKTQCVRCGHTVKKDYLAKHQLSMKCSITWQNDVRWAHQKYLQEVLGLVYLGYRHWAKYAKDIGLPVEWVRPPPGSPEIEASYYGPVWLQQLMEAPPPGLAELPIEARLQVALAGIKEAV